MSDDIDVLKPDTVLKPKIEEPRLYKVVLINDDHEAHHQHSCI